MLARLLSAAGTGAMVGWLFGVLDLVQMRALHPATFEVWLVPTVFGFYSFAGAACGALGGLATPRQPRRAGGRAALAILFFLVAQQVVADHQGKDLAGLGPSAHLAVAVFTLGVTRILWAASWRRRVAAAVALIVLLGIVRVTGAPHVVATARASASQAAAPNVPNVLLITIDTLRADHLGAYGYAKPTSPGIDAFAREGTLYEHAIAQSCHTTPSTASLLTSRFPIQHGHTSGNTRLGESEQTLAELLRARGYATVAFSGNTFVSPIFGLAQGFESFFMYDAVGLRTCSLMMGVLRRVDAATRKIGLGRLARYHGLARRYAGTVDGGMRDRALTQGFIRWLDTRERDRPFFAYLHYMSPHSPYDPSESSRRLFGAPSGVVVSGLPHEWLCYSRAEPLSETERNDLIALYDASIRGVDGLIADVLRELDRHDLRDSTLIVLTADHGEEFFEHGNWGHGQSLYQELVHVPLIMRLPGVVPLAARVSEPVMSVDILPTILAAAGAAPAPRAVGRNLLASDGAARSEPAYSQLIAENCFSNAEIGPVRKYVQWENTASKHLQMFDLREDPGEGRSLPMSESEVGSLRTRLASRDLLEVGTDTAETIRANATVRRRLEALGYVD